MHHLPLLEETLADIPDGFFENTFLIGCQHLLPTVLDLIHSVVSKGLDSKNIFLIGKCYSTDPSVVIELQQMGISVCDSSSQYNSHESYEDKFAENCISFLKNVMQQVDFKKIKNVIILDDGGQLHIACNQLMPNNLTLLGVEQTSKGASILQSATLRYPVMNVARSAPKLILEAPVIADMIVKNILPHIGENPKIMIVGNGHVGNAIYCKLKVHAENILLLDKDPKKDNITKSGIIENKHKDYFIIGATGENIFPELNKRSLLNGRVTLASASSLDLEFDAVHLRRERERSYNCHENIIVNNITLLNSGFPVNFSGARNDFIARDQFQLVNALILASMACVEKAPSLANQLIEMDKSTQKLYAERYISFMSTVLPA